MRMENVMSISEINKMNEELAKKDAKIVQLEADLAAEQETNLDLMEAIADNYERLLALEERVNGGAP